MKHLLIAALCFTGLLCLTACHKHDTSPKQYSTWIVNGQDTFRTNNVDSSIDCNPDHSYCRAILESNDLYNHFMLVFASDYFPTSGNYSYPSPSTNFSCAIHIYYNNNYYYHVSNEDYIEASQINNKPSYDIPPSWFVNYDNPTGDSILIQGRFNIP